MYLSSINGDNNSDIDDNSLIRQENAASNNSRLSQSSSTSCPTLLVVDDNSNSNDESLKAADIPSNSTLSPTRTTSSSPLQTTETSKDDSEQQRRRTSSVAKLLGGQPLNNQQYEEISLQLIEDQSTQNVNNNSDNGTDTPIPRSRSSITRSLLMNTERKENTSTTMTSVRPTSPGFSKDVEYLIRRELDVEHSPLTLCRNSSTPSIFQSLSSVRNTHLSSQTSLQPKVKRKRLTSKQAEPMLINKPGNGTSLSVCEPFELNASESSHNESLNSTPVHRPARHQNDLFRFDAPHRPTAHHQNQSHYSSPVTNTATNSALFAYHRLNLNSSVYAQLKLHHDRLSATNCSSSSSSSSSSPTCNSCPYPMTAELTLSTPIAPLLPNVTSHPIMSHHMMGVATRKTKAVHNAPNTREISSQQSFSTMSDQANASLSPTTLSSRHSAPLKKRLLHAYKHEQSPS